MHPYIILLLLPIIGIVVFWLLPFPLAIPVYLVILLASGLMYWTIVRAMKKRSKNGVEALIGAEARVVSKLGPHDEAQYRVKVRGELWGANSRDNLKPDETVKVLSVKGFTLVVGKNTAEKPSSREKQREQHHILDNCY
jgi:membrane protein implicated in regulation of membrane protease activity